VLISPRQAKLPSQENSFINLAKTPGVLFIDKTKYIELLDEDRHYRYRYVQHAGLGKSTFLNMLSRYYDIAEAATFDDVFRGLYISDHLTPWRSRLLVLQLDLSMIAISDNTATMINNFHSAINDVLEDFVQKYWGWIGNGGDSRHMICENNASTSLILVLVRIGRIVQTSEIRLPDWAFSTRSRRPAIQCSLGLTSILHQTNSNLLH
jgi:hypothetical protein